MNVELHNLTCICAKCEDARNGVKGEAIPEIKFEVITQEEMVKQLRTKRRASTYSALKQALKDNEPGTVLRLAAKPVAAQKTASTMYSWAGDFRPRLRLKMAYDKAAETLYIWIDGEKVNHASGS